MNKVNNYFATCSKGVEDLVKNELELLGIPDTKLHTGGVAFTGNLESAYKACLWSRVASRILFQLKEFEIQSDNDLYEQIMNVDWSQHFTEDNSLTIDCFSSHSVVKNSHFATLRVKDAIVDQFTQKTGFRPSIEKDNPDIRLNVYLSDKQCLLYLDLSGEALHKRGYRQMTGDAPLRETLAASMLYRAKWNTFYEKGLPFYDPMCGSGTLLIEAAMMAANIAPNLQRQSFGFSNWKMFENDIWQNIYDEAVVAKKEGLKNLPLIYGSDNSEKTVGIARKNISSAGLSNVIDVSKKDATVNIEPKAGQTTAQKNDTNSGLIVTNPPYGKRISQLQLLRTTYLRFGKQLKKNFNGWTVVVITSEQDLAKSLGLRAFRKNTLFNGPIKSFLNKYLIKSDISRHNTASEKQSKTIVKTSEEKPSEDKAMSAQANNTDIDADEHATMFINRLKKNYKHLKKWARKNNINCYRVYDADIPQYAVAIDKYDNWIHVQEYQAPKTIDKNRAFQRVNDVIDSVADVLETQQEYVVLKVRKRQEGSSQYQKHDQKKQKMSVRENDLKFLINMYDYIDTGLFLDHRITRQLIKQLAHKRSFLNLFAYTGSVTVYAAAGGAKSTTTVDMSNTYLDWAKENLSVNGYLNSRYAGKVMANDKHKFIREDCLEWIGQAINNKQKYQLIFVDPPTFSNSKKMSTILDIKKDHAALLSGCLSLLTDDGQIIFSTNARKFKLDNSITDECFVKEITSITTTEDFRRKPLHRCWCLTKQETALALPKLF